MLLFIIFPISVNYKLLTIAHSLGNTNNELRVRTV